MRLEWKLFKIGGIEVSIHLSLVFLMVYVFLISSSQFPWVIQISKLDPSHILSSPILWGFIFTISLISSVLAHELAHALMSRKRMKENHEPTIRRITLMGLGGVSELEPGISSPGSEIRMALAGPFLSLGLGGLLLLLYHLNVNDNLSFFGFWMGRVNLALGLFNLIPAFPTDGGRVLRALFSLKQGLIVGTRNAVRVSYWVSAILFLVGLTQFNFLLILISSFLFLAGRSELFQLESKVLLKNRTVRDLIRPITPIRKDQTLEEAAAQMESLHPPLLKITGMEPQRLLSPENLKDVPRSKWNAVEVGRIALPIHDSVEPNESLEKAFGLMLRSGRKFIPVIEHQDLVGVVSFSELVELIQLLQLTESPTTHTASEYSVPQKSAHGSLPH